MYDRKAADARYRKRHRKEINESTKTWKREHSEQNKEINKNYRLTHRTEIKESDAIYRKSHKKELKEYNAKYYRDHPEDYKNRLNRWRRDNPEKATAQVHKRRALRTQAGGSYTLSEWVALCLECKHRCLCCNRRRKLTPDHVTPIAKGGSSNIENIQPLCQTCNSKKHTSCVDYRNT